MVNVHVETIEKFVKTNFSDSTIIESKTHSMFWTCTFCVQTITVKIQGDVGGFDVTLVIDNNDYPLWQADREVINHSTTNKENLLFQLEIVKSFVLNILK